MRYTVSKTEKLTEREIRDMRQEDDILDNGIFGLWVARLEELINTRL